MPFDLKKQFAFDSEKAEDGVWIPLGDSGARLLIGKIGTERHNRAILKAQRPYRHKLQTNTMTPDETKNMVSNIANESLLLGWEEMLYDGTPIPYSKANGLRMVLEFPELRELVYGFASDLSNFQAQEDEADAKNSPPFSGGTSPGERLLTD